MSAWPALAAERFVGIRGSTAEVLGERRRRQLRRALLIACLLGVLVVEGAALAHSYMWAAPLVGLTVIAVARDLPLVSLVGVTLLVRVLTSEAVSSPRAQYSGSLNLSGLIALLLILLAGGLILRRRRSVGAAFAAGLWLLLTTAIAVRSHGASTETIREGVREASFVALAIVVCNARGAIGVSVATRMVQLAGAGAAALALYQLATHTGLNVGGNIRSNGTFTHPNGAAMYFAIATTASLWRYLDRGRRRLDLLLLALFAAATISTFSVSGLASLLAMLITYGLLRPGSLRLKLRACAVGAAILVVFAATPVGARRITTESATNFTTAETRGTANTSLAWRFYKWRTLIPEWERAPLTGQGLGTTGTSEGTSENTTAGKQPHNEYVRYLVETGVLGFMTLLWAIARVTRRLVRRRRLGNDSGAANLALAIIAGCLLNGLGDNTLLYSTTAYAAFLIVAAALSSRATPRAPTGARG